MKGRWSSWGGGDVIRMYLNAIETSRKGLKMGGFEQVGVEEEERVQLWMLQVGSFWSMFLGVVVAVINSKDIFVLKIAKAQKLFVLTICWHFSDPS